MLHTELPVCRATFSLQLSGTVTAGHEGSIFCQDWLLFNLLFEKFVFLLWVNNLEFFPLTLNPVNL